MLVKSAVALVLLAGSVVAQSSSNTTIDPTSVPATTRSSWCSGQIATCGTLCSGAYDANVCDPPTLTYNCTCSSNHSSPGLQYYIQTMPTFICEQIYANCIQAGQNDAAAQALCNQNEKSNCGHLNPANFTAAASSTSSSMSSTASATGATATSASASTSTSKAAAPTLMAGQNFGSGVIAAGAIAAFGFLL